MSAAFWRSISAALARSSRSLLSASSAFSVQLVCSSSRRGQRAAHFLAVGDRARGRGAHLDQRLLHLEDDHPDHLRRILRPVEQLGDVGGEDIPRPGEDTHSSTPHSKSGPCTANILYKSRANIQESSEFCENSPIFDAEKQPKILAKWWDLPPTVGQISDERHGAADQFVGQSLAFLDAVERASRAAPLNRPVLVIGERGTGKELIAERLHHLSSRWAGPLIIMNCAALPENLIEAELFGHEAGSFTGAAKTRHGRFEEADGGTLFLDELATLSIAGPGPAAARGRIWRGHPDRRVQADLGRRPHRRRDQRASAALVDKGRFRADLLDRLSFEVITLPPLRARQGDIPLLAEHFGRRMAVELDWPNWPGFTPRRMAELEAYPWPGNVRELRNVVERAVYRARGSGAADRRDPVRSVPFALGAGERARRLRAPIAAADEPAPQCRSRPRSRADRPDRRLPRRRLRLRTRSCSRTRWPQPLQPARHRGRARPQLRPAAPRAEAPQAARREAAG